MLLAMIVMITVQVACTSVKLRHYENMTVATQSLQQV